MLGTMPLPNNNCQPSSTDDLVSESYNQIAIDAVRKDWQAIQYVFPQTRELSMMAIRRNALALQYIQEQDEEMCLEAVSYNGLALEFVKHQTSHICLEAVKNTGLAIQFVKKSELDLNHAPEEPEGEKILEEYVLDEFKIMKSELATEIYPKNNKEYIVKRLKELGAYNDKTIVFSADRLSEEFLREPEVETILFD